MWRVNKELCKAYSSIFLPKKNIDIYAYRVLSIKQITAACNICIIINRKHGAIKTILFSIRSGPAPPVRCKVCRWRPTFLRYLCADFYTTLGEIQGIYLGLFVKQKWLMSKTRLLLNKAKHMCGNSQPLWRSHKIVARPLKQLGNQNTKITHTQRDR